MRVVRCSLFGACCLVYSVLALMGLLCVSLFVVSCGLIRVLCVLFVVCRSALPAVRCCALLAVAWCCVFCGVCCWLCVVRCLLLGVRCVAVVACCVLLFGECHRDVCWVCLLFVRCPLSVG